MKQTKQPLLLIRATPSLCIGHGKVSHPPRMFQFSVWLGMAMVLIACICPVAADDGVMMLESKDGRTIQGSVVKVRGNSIVLLRTEGYAVEVPLESLAAETVKKINEKQFTLTWATDWKTFGQILSKQVTDNPQSKESINRAFLGKTVVWTGRVSAMEGAFVRLDMEPTMIGGFPLTKLALEPTPSQRGTWNGVKIGDEVVLRTTLAAGPLGENLLTTLQGMGPNAGNNIAIIGTKGGACLKRLEPLKQNGP